MYVFYVIVITCVLSCDSIKKLDDDDDDDSVSVCRSVTFVSPAKTSKPIPFGILIYIDEGQG